MRRQQHVGAAGVVDQPYPGAAEAADRHRAPLEQHTVPNPQSRTTGAHQIDDGSRDGNPQRRPQPSAIIRYAV
ncbi:hypothetical protein [Streptomyces sp. NPDC096013]|uniref:hypothetical protein n=1 Tax=Streptomyces sp. NPDC096013 TaxID=3366069 RepID=UPI0037FDBEC8